MRAIVLPVSGSNVAIDSTSSPKSSMRMPDSSYAGTSSITSPRARKVPRRRSMSFRS
jgi:hypothetical protein